MKWKVYTVPLALLVLLCVACNARRDKKVAVSDVQLEDVKVESKGAGEDETPPAPDQSGNSQQQVRTSPVPPAANPDWDRKIVKTADLALKVKNYQVFTSRLHIAVKQSGGYIAQEQMSQNAGQIENTVTIKVPVDRFELLMGEMPGDSDKLEEKKISSEDVTMEMVDTKSHLQTKKEVRERYLELLKQAHSMKDIIAIQNEINDIQQDMDEAQGRIAWLGHSSAYSTINLRFYQVLDETIHDDPAPGFAHRLIDSIRNGWTGLSLFLLEMMNVWPLWIGIGLAVVWVRKWKKRTKAYVKPIDTASVQ